MTIDLYASFRRGQTARRSDRHTTPDSDPLRTRARRAQRPAISHKVDPGTVTSLVSALIEQIEGRNLASIIPVAVGLLSDRLGISASGEFQDATSSRLYTIVGELGRTVQAPAARGEAANIRTQLRARAMGVSPSTVVRTTTPRLRRRFDEVAALLSDGRTMAAVLGDGRDGMPPGAEQVLVAFFTSVRNNFLTGDADGVRQAAEDVGLLLVALDAAVNADAATSEPEPAQRRSTGGPPGYVVATKALGRVTHIEVGDEMLPARDVTITDGRVRRRNRTRG